MTSIPAEEALRMLGVDALEFPEKRKTKDICICGHPESRHYFDETVSLCKPTVMECPCARFKAVIRAEDTRLFQYKTQGPGTEHALTKGLIRSAQKKKTVEWVEDVYKCALCGVLEDIQIYPIAGSEETGYRVARDPKVENNMGRKNALLCPACVETL